MNAHSEESLEAMKSNFFIYMYEKVAAQGKALQTNVVRIE
jgi:hypothetical protein